MLPWAVGLALVALGAAVRSRLIGRARREGPGTMTAPPARQAGARASTAATVVIAILAVVVAAGSVVTVYRIGDSGSTASWTGKFSPTPISGPGLPRVPKRTPTDRRQRIGRAARPQNRNLPSRPGSPAASPGSLPDRDPGSSVASPGDPLPLSRAETLIPVAPAPRLASRPLAPRRDAAPPELPRGRPRRVSASEAPASARPSRARERGRRATRGSPRCGTPRPVSA